MTEAKIYVGKHYRHEEEMAFPFLYRYYSGHELEVGLLGRDGSIEWESCLDMKHLCDKLKAINVSERPWLTTFCPEVEVFV